MDNQTESAALLKQAAGLISARDYKQAGLVLARAVALCGADDIHLLMQIDKFYIHMGDHEMRLKISDKLLAYGADRRQLLPHRAYNFLELLRYNEALAVCETYLKEFGEDGKIYEILVKALVELGGYKESVPFIERLRSGAVQLPLEVRMAYDSNLIEAQAYAEVYTDAQYAGLLAQINEMTRPLMRNEELPRTTDYFKKLKVGYISPDFRNHPVGFFIYPIIRRTPASEHAIYCYSLQPLEESNDNMYGLDIVGDLKSHGKWSVVWHMPDDRLERTILREKLDIAFDLSCHSRGNKLNLFAKRLAPIQITYIGFPTSSGVAAMDYALVDANTDPVGAERFYTEKLIRMSQTSLCHALIPLAEPAPEPPVKHNGTITFGCFCNILKLTPKTFRMIAGVLNAVGDSRLLLVLGKDHPDIVGSVRQGLIRAGCPIDRVDIEPAVYKLAYAESYNRVDIILDTFPFNGATTTCDALNMGVPVVTLAGEMQAARRGLSILRNVGLDELIATTEDEYVAIAAGLAGDIQRLAHYKTNLRTQKAHSNLADVAAFVDEFALQMRRVWIDHCRSAALTTDYSQKTDGELRDEMQNAEKYIAYDSSEDVLAEYERLRDEVARRGN